MPENGLLVDAGGKTVAVEGGEIVEPSGRYDLVLHIPEGEVRPGLINAHDHLHRNHYGRIGQPPYADAYAWARHAERDYRDLIQAGRAMPRREALLEGAWKNLFAGVTTVVHHDRWEPDFERHFPLRVVRLPSEDSLGLSPDLPGVPSEGAFALHVAEGISSDAAAEVQQLQQRGLLGPRLIAVHGVGMDREGIDLFRASGAALVWCPSSNHFLFNRTAPAELLREGLDLLLGSDSLLSGSGDLLDELRFARTLELIDDRWLEAAVGETAARRLGLPEPSVVPGNRADLVVLAKPLLEASAEDVELVLVGGVPRVAHPRFAPALERSGWSGTPATVRGVTRWICPEVPADAPRATDAMNQFLRDKPLNSRALKSAV